MSSKHTIHPTQAGLDITTGHGTDSFFTTAGPTDPWAPRCVTTLIDTVINHNQVLYPLPSRAAVEMLEDSLLPLVFVEGGNRGLLEAKTDVSAEEVQLTSDQLIMEYQNFTEWARQEAVALAAWGKFHREAPRIAESHPIHVPRHLVDDFWSTGRGDDLVRQTGIPDADLNYAFDVFVRSIQYHRILGETTLYFSHPVRDRALGALPVLVQHQDQWSWGRYLVQLIQEERASRDIGWLLDTVSAVRTLTRKYNATWYNLGQRPRPEQLALLSTIASESDLPAKLKDSIQRAMKIALAVGIVISSSIPVVSVILGLGSIAVEFWSGKVPGRLGTIPVFKGRLVWPGLVGKQH